jgi:hypothetical protein
MFPFLKFNGSDLVI